MQNLSPDAIAGSNIGIENLLGEGQSGARRKTNLIEVQQISDQATSTQTPDRNEDNPPILLNPEYLNVPNIDDIEADATFNTEENNEHESGLDVDDNDQNKFVKYVNVIFAGLGTLVVGNMVAVYFTIFTSGTGFIYGRFLMCFQNLIPLGLVLFSERCKQFCARRVAEEALSVLTWRMWPADLAERLTTWTEEKLDRLYAQNVN